MSQRETKSGEDDGDGTERITVRPPFDPVEFARQSERPTIPPPAPLPSISVPTPPLAWAEAALEAPPPVLDEMTVVELAVAAEDLEWFDLPALARSLIRHVDGRSPLPAVCAMAGVSLTDAIRLLEGMARDKIVVWR